MFPRGLDEALPAGPGQARGPGSPLRSRAGDAVRDLTPHGNATIDRHEIDARVLRQRTNLFGDLASQFSCWRDHQSERAFAAALQNTIK